MNLLHGKIAVITGGGTGIGKSTALLFAEEGSKVVVVGRRLDPLVSVVDEIKGKGGIAISIQADMEDGEAAASVIQSTIDEYGRVDILVNNAGHSSRVRSIRWVDPTEWESVFKVNVEGVYRITQAAIKDMLKRGEGTVITVSSTAALTPGLLGGAPYSAAKAASYNMMRGLNSELRQQGIRACTILPGEIDTPIMANRPLPPNSEKRSTMMQPSDIADAILLCAGMPQRTIIEEMVLMPTFARDLTDDIEAARNLTGF